MKKLVLGAAVLAGLVAAGRVIFHAVQAGGAISSVDQNQERLVRQPHSTSEELSTTNAVARGYRDQLQRIARQLQEIAQELRA